MTLKTSLFSKALILSDVKRFWWVSALYTVLLFFILPLRHIMQKNAIHQEWVKNQIRYSLILTSSHSNFQILLILVVPVILAVLVFRYMQKSNAAAMIHSLPYTRKAQYYSHGTAGLLLLVVHVLLNGLVLMILQGITNLGDYYSVMDVLGWAAQTLSLNILFFSVAVFVGMFTGSSVAQMAFNYIIHILPAGVYVLFRHNLGQLIHGYSNSRLYDPILEKLPIFALLNVGVGVRHHISTWNLIIYMLIAIVLLIVGYFVYKLRNIEAAGDVIAFKAIRPVFKYGVTICSTLLGGVYFTSIAGGSFLTLVLGYLFSSFLGYWIAEMLIEKSLKVFGAYKGYVAYIAMMLLILVGIQTDVTGYVGRVPNVEAVEKVYFGYNGAEWMDIDRGVIKVGHDDDFKYIGGNVFDREENIEHVITLHQHLIEQSNYRTGTYQYIVYRLKNGKYIKRHYLIDEKQYADQLRPIYESLEYKLARFPVLEQNEEDIKWIEVVDDRVQKKSLMITKPQEIQGFITALQADIDNLTYEDLIFNRMRTLRATVMDNNEQAMGYAIRSSHTNVEEWMRSQGHYEEVALMPEDIEYVVLEDIQRSDSPTRVEVRDRAVIEEIVSLSADFGYDHMKRNVMVSLYITGSTRYPEYMDYMQTDIMTSDALRDYINKLDN